MSHLSVTSLLFSLTQRPDRVAFTLTSPHQMRMFVHDGLRRSHLHALATQSCVCWCGVLVVCWCGGCCVVVCGVCVCCCLTCLVWVWVVGVFVCVCVCFGECECVYVCREMENFGR